MQVIILCDGRGTRLKPFTEDIPKPMMELFGCPFLQHQIMFFKKYGYRSFWLCTGYKGEKIQRYFEDGSRFGVKIQYSHEETPLGTGGAIIAIKDHLEDEFLVANGDTLADYNLIEFAAHHSDLGRLGIMAVVDVTDPERCNVVNLDQDLVEGFEP